MTLAPFISLDGIDGTGKSTQCRLLVDWLNATGVPAIGCTDPGGTPVGDQLRKILLESRTEMSARTEALLFMASRAELVAKVIRPESRSGPSSRQRSLHHRECRLSGPRWRADPFGIWQVGRFSSGGLLPILL